MLISFRDILDGAERGGYAVPAFNVYNMETVMGVIMAAEALCAPIIMQFYNRLATEGNIEFLAPIILHAASKAKVPVCMHLDHGAGEKEVMIALRSGATGIMIDNSEKPFEENIAATSAIVRMCSQVGVSVEGELGHIGSAKDGVSNHYTQTDAAAEYVARTGICSLAAMVGTAHGRYKQPPQLAFERISELKEATGVPIVLHGGSGVPDDQVREAVKRGIRKVNFGTDLCYAFLNNVFTVDRSIYAIDLFMKKPIAAGKKYAEEKIILLGADKKA